MNKAISMFLTDWALPFSIAFDEIQCQDESRVRNKQKVERCSRNEMQQSRMMFQGVFEKLSEQKAESKIQWRLNSSLTRFILKTM